MNEQYIFKVLVREDTPGSPIYLRICKYSFYKIHAMLSRRLPGIHSILFDHTKRHETAVPVM